jgi:TolB-like protein/DNA-binding SARP family transcriptional activator/predicted Zn-dependent protease
MSRIHIAALGGLRIARDGEEIVDLPGQPVRCALLLYLALERAATRDELATLLWPERSASRARRLLSQTVYELRRQLGDDWLATGGDRVEVTDALTVDALSFVRAVEVGRDDVALAEYGGPFLDGVHPGGTPAFEHWADGHRSRLARLHRDVCRRLTADRIEQGDVEGGLAVAYCWAGVDPLDDEAHHRIIALLAEAGRRSEALRHFEEYRERIARELQVEPLEETQALVARLREGEGPPPLHPTADLRKGSQRQQTPRPEEVPLSEEASRSQVAPRSPEAPAASAGGADVPWRERLTSASPGRRWLLGSTTAAVLFATALLLWSAGAQVAPSIDQGGPGALLDPRGIAVLPFVNLSADPEQEYFSDGITEDLLTTLSRIADLTVISRTSVMQYKDTGKTIRQIGEELGVAHVLEGSVRRVGDTVRITAQLIDARTDQHLWAESYDRDLTDIFAIQTEIAQRIAGALRARLAPDERERLDVRPTADLTAYDFYLQGRQYYHRHREEDHRRAIELFLRAIEMDSSFALAWAGLGDAYAVMPNRYGAPLEWADSGMVAARRAIALDPGLAEGYSALGGAYHSLGRYARAAEAYEEALALNPSFAPAIARTGYLMYATGPWDEALRLFNRSLALDPVTRIPTMANMAVAYGALGLFARAQETYELLLALEPDNRPGLRTGVLLAIFLEPDPAVAVARAEELLSHEPDHPGSSAAAATAWLFSGEYAEAKRHLERAYQAAPRMTLWGRYVAVQLGFTLWKTGEKDRARRMFADFERYALAEIAAGNEDRELRYSLAVLHAVQGNTSEAYHWLDEMVATGWTDYLLLSRDPLLEDLHGDERFEGIVARNRAEIERQRARVEREGW